MVEATSLEDSAAFLLDFIGSSSSAENLLLCVHMHRRSQVELTVFGLLQHSEAFQISP